jgi:hypothetical protein
MHRNANWFQRFYQLAEIETVLPKSYSLGPMLRISNFSCRKMGVFCYFFCKKVIITLFFEKIAKFVAENLQKSQKIAIIPSTPDLNKASVTRICFFR